MRESFVHFEAALDSAPDPALCRRPGFRAAPGRPSLWEGIADGETRRDRDQRQAKAVLVCRQCPALDACRRWLADLDARQLSVDGVVAGEARKWRTRNRRRQTCN